MLSLDPEIAAQTPTKLNEQQLQMLSLFKTPMPEEEYKEIKRHVLFILAKQLDEEMEKWEKENNITAETYEQWGKEHFRTPYRKSG